MEEEFGLLEEIKPTYHQNNVCNLSWNQALNLFKSSKRRAYKAINKLVESSSISYIIPRLYDQFVMIRDSDINNLDLFSSDVHRHIYDSLNRWPIRSANKSIDFYSFQVFYIKKIHSNTYLALRQSTPFDSDTPRDYLYLVSEDLLAKLALENKLITSEVVEARIIHLKSILEREG